MQLTSGTPVASPSSAATGSRSPGPTPSTPTPPTRRCSPRPSTGSSTASGCEGERLGEVVAGAVLKHSRDFNLTRESVLGSQLAPETPATDIQQACGTGLQAAIQVANKIALGQIDVGIAGGTDTTSDAPVAISEKLRKKLIKVNAAEGHRAAGSRRSARSGPATSASTIPQNGEPRTGLSMGEHAALTALEWQITREAQDELAVALAPEPRRGRTTRASRTT